MLSSVDIEILKETLIYDKQWYEFKQHRWRPIDRFSMIKYIKEKLNQTLFTRPFNKDPKHLICFNNGVYDFNLNQFRDGLPSDCCTLCTGYDYVPTFNNALDDYLRKVFPDTEDYIALMKAMNRLFKGHNDMIYAYNMGNSGISTLYRLIDNMYGEYGLRTHIELLKQRKLYYMETELEYLNKNFKGRYIRFDMDVDTDVFKNNNLAILTSINTPNSNIKIKPIQPSIELQFKSTFLNNTLYDKYHYPIDHHLTKQFPNFALALMTKLINLQKTYLKYLYFYCNDILVKDINDYVLIFYLDIMFL